MPTEWGWLLCRCGPWPSTVAECQRRASHAGNDRAPGVGRPGSETRPGQWRTGGRSGGRLADRGRADERRSTARADAGSGGAGEPREPGRVQQCAPERRRRGAEGAIQRRRRLVGQWKHKLEWASNGWPGKGNAAWHMPNWRVFSIFIFFKNIFYKNIFLVSQFTVLYPYRPAEGRQGAYRPSAGWPAPCRRPALAAGPCPPVGR